MPIQASGTSAAHMKPSALAITSAGDGARVRHENRDGSCAVERGEVAHRATVARKLRRTRALVTQLLDVRQPAADLREAVLHLEAVDGREPMSGRTLRAVARAGTREEQRVAWGATVDARGADDADYEASAR